MNIYIIGMQLQDYSDDHLHHDKDPHPPEGLKAHSGRLEGEDVHQPVLELVHLGQKLCHCFNRHCHHHQQQQEQQPGGQKTSKATTKT